MRENKISLPMVAIGGLTPDDIDPLAELGIGVAMSGNHPECGEPCYHDTSDS